MRWSPRARSGVAMGWRDAALEWVDRAGWEVVRSFGDEASERRALAEAVGVTDTSAVGKLLVQGPGRERVLADLTEPLAAGGHALRAWRGDPALPSGFEGWVARLSRSEHYVAVPLATLPSVQALLEDRLKALEQVHVTPITHARDVITLCGPRAADTLSSLSNLDLSDPAFPDQTARFGALAHISAFIVRADQAERPRYDLHVDRSYGEYLWDTLLEAAREHGGRPVGLGALDRTSSRSAGRVARPADPVS